MMLRPSLAAAASSAMALRTALASRPLRQALRFSTASNSTWSGTDRIEPPSPPASGEVSVSVKALTPTTVAEPASMAFRRAALDFTSPAFM